MNKSNETVIEDYVDIPISDKVNDMKNLNIDKKTITQHVTLLISEYLDVFSEKPSCTLSIEHVINLETNTLEYKTHHQMPHHLIDIFNNELNNTINQGVIEPSNFPYCLADNLVMVHGDSIKISGV